ncbi:aspartate/glutamate racemase family protein [Bacilliculturomica massiliensis]|uniref:aspartate/glutamate racemase family protein n=1 Tax=Bacilliculturomica massiliensis TaxID=1917867 RepID=UPI0010311D1C|nr:aspartate/glutamate racemase family protein [Bacilliculturomica massiliensis]
MDRNPKIAVLRWEEGHVPEGLLQLETMPGNSTNRESYPFPVRLIYVEGANVETVITHPSKELLANMIRISKQLVEEEGIQAITTSCGFNAIFQKELAEALDVPVFTSALLQVPFAQNLIGKNKTVGVITANKGSLTKEHFHACGITDDMNVEVMGLEDAKEWSKIFDKPDEKFDMDAVTEEIIGVAKKGVADHPEIGAIVLECTDLPPYAAKIREAVKLPVFDFNSMMGHMAIALADLNLY